jgi:hypothetical protein
MLLPPSVSVVIVLPNQDWAGNAVNNLWRLIQPKETTERRLVMATDHNKICSHHAGGSRDLVSGVTGCKESFALRIDSSYLIC